MRFQRDSGVERSIFRIDEAWEVDGFESRRVRKLTFERSSRDTANNNTGVVLLFFSSYVVIVGIVLFNIIVAVLLEGFLGAIQQSEREEAAKEEKEAMQRAAGALDPLLATFAHFQSPQHLESEIHLLFRMLDVDDSGSLSFHEMQQGLESLPLKPPVIMSIEDWEALTMNGSVLDEENCLNIDAFKMAIRWQLMLYGQRLLGQRMRQVGPSTSALPAREMPFAGPSSLTSPPAFI
jgi:hypothetical protein